MLFLKCLSGRFYGGLGRKEGYGCGGNKKRLGISGNALTFFFVFYQSLEAAGINGSCTCFRSSSDSHRW